MIASPFAPKPSPALVKLAANSSASQHKKFEKCRREWWYEKVCGIKDREKHFFLVGHIFHAVADRYITGRAGTWEALFPAAWDKGLEPFESDWIKTQAGRAVELGLWQARPGVQVEFPVCFLTAPQHVDARGMPLLARADTYLDDKGTRKVATPTALIDGRPLPSDWNQTPPYVGFIDVLTLDDVPPEVADHKTSKKREYALTPAKLAEDLQVLSYAAVPLVLRPLATTVALRHNVFIKTECKTPAYKVDATATVDGVRALWGRIRRNIADMQLLREVAPKVENGNPYARANNWQLVKSAIEEGRAKDACNAYGGCPFKDLCFGRCTAEQLVQRMDSPDPLPFVQKPTPGANPFKPRSSSQPAGPAPARNKNPFIRSSTPKPTTLFQSPPQEHQMPFAKPAPATPPAFAVYQDVYVLDPDDATIQFRARITSLSEDGTTAMLGIYPNPDIMPEFHTLPMAYRIEVPKDVLFAAPHPLAKIRSYQEVLQASGVTDDISWKPAQAAAAPVPATVPLDKPLKREEPAGTTPNPFVKTTGVVTPLPGSGAAVQAAAAAASAKLHDSVRPVPPLPAGAPEWAKDVALGTVLTVAATEHHRWKQYAGKPAIVKDMGPGDTADSIYVSVLIDDLPQPDVNLWRFDAPAPMHAPGTITTPVAGTPIPSYASILATKTIPERAAALVGRVVSITLLATASPYNCILDAADANGITFANKTKTAVWAEIADLKLFDESMVPGRPPTKEEKAAAKEAAKAEKAAAKEAEKAKTDAAESTNLVDPGDALEAVISAIKGALDGGKVTRKVLEGVAPLLEIALQYQTVLEMGAGGTVGTGAIATPAPKVDGVLRAALDHAISTLTDARTKLG